ncbi:MAG TPA: hypothetical protein VG477_10125 [Thermoanaerobaculia bacterium]|nr:hypothetical protein [Thermoanaerobaculia bacterium]
MTLVNRGAWLFGVFLLGLSIPAAAASRPELQFPLIHLQGGQLLCAESQVQEGETVCVKGTYRERSVSIFWNTRAMSMSTEGAHGQATTPKRTMTTVRDGFLVWRDVEALIEYLDSIGIEKRRGGCNPFAGQADFKAGSSAQYTISWHSKNGRKRATLPFSTESSKRCPPEALDLFNRVVRLGNAVRIP